MIGIDASFQPFDFLPDRVARPGGAIHSFHWRGNFGFYRHAVVAKTPRVSLLSWWWAAYRPSEFSQP
jgi:hypothetical protein